MRANPSDPRGGKINPEVCQQGKEKILNPVAVGYSFSLSHISSTSSVFLINDLRMKRDTVYENDNALFSLNNFSSRCLTLNLSMIILTFLETVDKRGLNITSG